MGHIWTLSRFIQKNNIYVYEAFHVNCPSAARESQIVLFLTHVYDIKMYLKNCLISVSDVFFHSDEIFYFHLQKVQNVLYLKKCIFNIFFTL